MNWRLRTSLQHGVLTKRARRGLGQLNTFPFPSLLLLPSTALDLSANQLPSLLVWPHVFIIAGIIALSLLATTTIGIMVGIAIPILSFAPASVDIKRLASFALLATLCLG